MRYVSATGNEPSGHQQPYSAGAAFLRGSALGGSGTASALDQLAGDARLAAVFRQMRAIVGVSETEMARRVGANLTTVLDFEAGAVHALPPWPDTVRIVDRYAELSQIDPSPILSRLLTLMPAASPSQPRPIQPVGPRFTPSNGVSRSPRQSRPAALPVPLMTRIGNATPGEPRPSELPPGFDGRARERETTARTTRQSTTPSESRGQDAAAAAARRRRRTKRTLTLMLPIAAIAGLLIAMPMAPRTFYSVARMLPSPVDMPLRGMVDLAVSQTAPVREGLRWIEMDDPRIRKTDRIGGR